MVHTLSRRFPIKVIQYDLLSTRSPGGLNSICLLFLDKAFAGPQQRAILKSNAELFSHFPALVPSLHELLILRLALQFFPTNQEAAPS
jgi:hypothetical protein